MAQRSRALAALLEDRNLDCSIPPWSEALYPLDHGPASPKGCSSWEVEDSCVFLQTSCMFLQTPPLNL